MFAARLSPDTSLGAYRPSAPSDLLATFNEGGERRKEGKIEGKARNKRRKLEREVGKIMRGKGEIGRGKRQADEGRSLTSGFYYLTPGNEEFQRTCIVVLFLVPLDIVSPMILFFFKHSLVTQAASQ